MNKEHPLRDEQPWSVPLIVSDVPPQGLDAVLAADAGVRAQLAQSNGLDDLASLDATLHVARRGREGLHVTGELRARAVQTCVVTLEPFEVEIVEPIDVEFEPARTPAPPRDERSSRRRGRAKHEQEDEEGMDDLDAPDEIVDGKVDLGALASEFLTLGVDPYPRKPGADFETRAEPEPAAKPFSGLAALAGRTRDKGKP